MRLRFVHTLSLLLLAAVVLAVLAMGGVMAWNLRNGFADYLVARDIERLEQFAAFVAQSAEQAGGLDELKRRGTNMRRLMDGFAQRQGVRPPPPPPPLMERPNGPFAGPGDRHPPGRDTEVFAERVSIFQTDGTLLWGKPLVARTAALIERPVRLTGEIIAVARMVKLAPVPDDIDAKFLTAQYGGIASVAMILLALAMAAAWWVAGRWVQPLLAVQDATGRIARGEFGFRLDDGRSDEIGDVMRNINAMARGLGQLEGARRKWIADMSHELRTPLTVLRGEIEALADGIRPTSAAAIASLRDEVLNLAALVDDLHLLAMSDLNALPCHFAEVDAIALARKVLQRFELRAANAGLTLHLNAPPEAHVFPHWDARRVEQLLGNLLDNSLRYTDAPGKIEVSIALDKDAVCIDVDDSAPGVASADLARLFEPLYRADAARSRHTGGSGLGLSICSAIVLAHRGTIQATRSPLGGLRLRMVLPFDPMGRP